MKERDALIHIQAAWLLWAKHELDEAEAMAEIAEALEGAGLTLVVGVEGEGLN